jgi:hypothetical protein
LMLLLCMPLAMIIRRASRPKVGSTGTKRLHRSDPS